MRNIFLVVTILIFSNLLFAQFELAQTEMNVIGNGARSSGMGYAFTGVADDATAISTNPAGIAQLREAEGSVIGRVNSSSADISFPDFEGLTGNVDLKSSFNVNFASVIVPFSVGDRNVVGGIAYRRYVDSAMEGTITLGFAGLGEGSTDFEVTGGIQAVSPSLGVEVAPNISAGFTANILFGSQKMTVDGDDAGSEDYSGFNMDIGLLFKASDQFSIGAVGTLPWTLTREVEGFETEIDIPFTASFGVAFKPVPELTIAADYRLRPFSDVEYSHEFGSGEMGWEDINSFHVGMEYLVMSGDLIIPLRGGFYTNPSVSTSFDPNADDGVGDQIAGGVITFGAGVVAGNLVLDASVELGSYDDYNIPLYLDGFGWTYMAVEQSFARFNLGAVLHFGQ